MQTIEILEKLIAFDTTSRNPNLELVHFIRDLLADHKIECQLIPDETGKKANLYATIGPQAVGGVMLSGHTDVVPVDGQDWTKNPEPAGKGTNQFGRLFFYLPRCARPGIYRAEPDHSCW